MLGLALTVVAAPVEIQVISGGPISSFFESFISSAVFGGPVFGSASIASYAMPSPSPEPFEMEMQAMVDTDAELVFSQIIPSMMADLIPRMMMAAPVAAPQPEPQGPCNREVDMCIRESVHTSSAGIERAELHACLLSHYEELTPSCKCFLHNVLGDVATAKSVAPPPQVDVVVIDEYVVDVDSNHGACMLTMPLLFLAVFFITRRLCRACAAKKTMVAVVAVPDIVITNIEPLVAKQEYMKPGIVPSPLQLNTA